MYNLVKSLFTGVVFCSFIHAADCNTIAKSVRSHEYPALVPMKINNNTNGQVQVIWIGYDGTEHLYKTLTPQQGYIQHTYPSHPWVMRNSKGECLGVYYPDGQERSLNLETGLGENIDESVVDSIQEFDSLGRPFPPRNIAK